mmetsp:Transcript_11700/g.35655  ORF Transcript_11700/g.35655 Transcript_11700/m.35655 type:complete len:304 (+) Transcript_11700:339-1250(+)
MDMLGGGPGRALCFTPHLYTLLRRRRAEERICLPTRACSVSTRSGTWFYRKEEPSAAAEKRTSSTALLLLHPNYLHSEIFAPQLSAFRKAGIRTFAPDLRGHGRSSPPHEGEKYTHTEQLAEFLDAMSVETVDVLGVEMGGAVALDFAECFSGRVRKLILVNTSAFLHRFPSHSYFNISRAMEKGGLNEARRQWLCRDDYRFTRQNEPVFWFVQQLISEYGGWHFLKDDRMTWMGKGIEGSASITAQTLIILGEHCESNFTSIAKTLKQKISGAQLTSIGECGMLPNLEAPKVFNRVVLEFLK